MSPQSTPTEPSARAPFYRRTYSSTWFGSWVLQPVGAAALGLLLFRLAGHWIG